MSQAIPDAVQELLSLFSAKLADVRFPDVDRASLARAVEEAHTAAVAVATAETSLEAARTQLREHHDELLRRAQRALAYARVYAEGDEALTRELEGISIPRSSRRRGDDAATPSAEPTTLRRRGRPRKTEAGSDAPSIEPAAAE